MIHPSALVDAAAQCHDRVTIGRGAIVQGACRIGADVEIGPGAVLDAGDGTLVVESGAQVGAGAILGAPITISQGAHVLPGTVVSRDVPPHAVVAGNPAQIIGYTTLAAQNRDLQPEVAPRQPGAREISAKGVTFHRMPKVLDLRGNLTVGEFERSIPFQPRRYFMVFGVPNSEIRGEHAHRTCHQFLICAHGSCAVMVDDGEVREEVVLDDPSLGLHLPPLTWGVQYKYSQDAVLLVFASEYYDPNEYIRDYPEFLELSRHRRRQEV